MPYRMTPSVRHRAIEVYYYYYYYYYIIPMNDKIIILRLPNVLQALCVRNVKFTFYLPEARNCLATCYVPQ